MSHRFFTLTSKEVPEGIDPLTSDGRLGGVDELTQVAD